MNNNMYANGGFSNEIYIDIYLTDKENIIDFSWL